MEIRLRKKLDNVFGTSPEIDWLKDIVVKTQLGKITDDEVNGIAESKTQEINMLKEAYSDVGFIPATEGEVIYGKIISNDMIKDGEYSKTSGGDKPVDDERPKSD